MSEIVRRPETLPVQNSRSTWRDVADQAIHHALDQTTEIAERQDAGISKGACVQEFHDRFATELMPARAECWNRALDLLVQYGMPMRYSDGDIGRPYRSRLCTGFMALDEPICEGTDVIVPAVRLMIRDGVDSDFPEGEVTALAKQVDKARTARSEKKQAKRTGMAWRALDETLSSLSIYVEPILASNNAERISDFYIYEHRELRYPTTRYQAANRNMHDNGSTQYIAKLLQSKSDAVFYGQPLDAFTDEWQDETQEFHLEKQTVPRVKTSDFSLRQDETDYTQSIERKLDTCRKSQANFETLCDMLRQVQTPLRNIPGFQSERNT